MTPDFDLFLLLLFVACAVAGLLLTAIAYWGETMPPPPQSPTGRFKASLPDWQDIPRNGIGHNYDKMLDMVVERKPPPATSPKQHKIHPYLIDEYLTDIERRIIADALDHGENLPGVGPSFRE